MNLFVNHENQTILWNTINKHPLFEKIKTTHEKDQWFRRMIEQTYINEKNNNKTLQELNRETIAKMISILKNENETELIPKTPPENNNPPINNFKNNKTFDEIQTEYKKMLSKNSPKEIDFKEKITDEPIHDMNETLERIKKERENIPPLFPSGESSSSQQQSNEILLLLKEFKTEQQNIMKTLLEILDRLPPVNANM
jgi:hypothetical protein